MREYHPSRGSGWEAGGTTLQGERVTATASGEYREGTVKRPPVRGVKENLKPSADERSEGEPFRPPGEGGRDGA